MNDRHAGVSVPIACTLEARELRSRFAEISALADHALLHHEQEGRTLHLRYGLGAAAQLERLVAQEQQCCAFLQFDMHRTPDAVHLDITAPAEAGEFVPLLYAHFVGQAARLDCACAIRRLQQRRPPMMRTPALFAQRCTNGARQKG